jgi:mono/diheme cytochrome c family protein
MKSSLGVIAVLAASALLLLSQARPGDGAATEAAGPRLLAGKAIYDQHCAACHGLSGDGLGPASVWLFPRPRNFSAGLFKIKSTPSVALPTDEDLIQTVTLGMPGSSMPGFSYLSEQERRDVVEYVKHLTTYEDETGRRLNRFENAEANGQLAPPIDVSREPPATIQTLVQGAELFTSLACITCHGETGAGDGPSASTLKDTEGLFLPPRDFNTGAFRGGASGRDLYLRIAAGMPGTPMAPFGDDVMSQEERWSLVHYIQSLRRKDRDIDDILAPQDHSMEARRLAQIPTDLRDPIWDRMDPVRVPLNPLWPEPEPVPAVSVRAVHDGRHIAFLLQWRDPIPNGAPVRVQDFQDSAALQFALGDATPFLGMGDPQNPVNLWIWKAGWQQEINGERPDVNTVYASMHTDLYPEASPLYRTAEAAGNLFAVPSRTSPIEDANATGFGTLEAQPAKGQNVQGKGLWFDGHWSVLFVRELQSSDPDDVAFSPGKPVQVAFAIWDGENRDRNGRKVISNWFRLTLR